MRTGNMSPLGGGWGWRGVGGSRLNGRGGLVGGGGQAAAAAATRAVARCERHPGAVPPGPNPKPIGLLLELMTELEIA